MSSDENYPLIITGDEGCGKTQLIIKWLTEFNRKDKITTKTNEESPNHMNLNNNQTIRSEEHTSEIQSLVKIVCRPLLEKKKISLNF